MQGRVVFGGAEGRQEVEAQVWQEGTQVSREELGQGLELLLHERVLTLDSSLDWWNELSNELCATRQILTDVKYHNLINLGLASTSNY